MYRHSTFIFFILLLVPVAYLVNLDKKKAITFNETAPSLLEQRYDYFMTNVDTLHLTHEGEQQYRLKAHRITHYTDPDFSDLTSPDIVIFQASEPPWHITASLGKLSYDQKLNQDKLELSGNVIVHKVSLQNQPIDIFTEKLVIYPDTKYISTDAHALLISTGSEISSTGMTADLTTNVINFLSKVKSRHE